MRKAPICPWNLKTSGGTQLLPRCSDSPDSDPDDAEVAVDATGTMGTMGTKGTEPWEASVSRGLRLKKMEVGCIF